MDDCERGPYYRALDDVLLHQAHMTIHKGPVHPQPVVVLEIPGALTNTEYFHACFYRERRAAFRLPSLNARI